MSEKKENTHRIKLIIQIPCFNEEETLPIVLGELPRELPGVDIVEWLVIDDGSTDRTVEVARAHGVDHIVSHPQNKGLATAFTTGLKASLKNGADIIVNTDADNQYKSSYIKDLIQPILDNKAEFVVGARPINKIEGFSRIKKILQRLGSWTVRMASGTDIPDAPSGFRAISRNAAQKLNIFSGYTYTLETIIQAGKKGIAMSWVPVETNEELRPSRLLSSIPSYIFHSMCTIIRIFIVYRPFRFFASIGVVFSTLGTGLLLRFLYFYFTGNGSGHVQSVVIAGILLGIGFHTILIAFVADLISVNRRLLEQIRASIQ
ncbi:glycosyl transferase [Desulfocapsa sulfexigens DSM 10523]|uniref:Glycosyl transferase n=1 Tax=Desulfocapsa sulfexigens (strain DSM 10523 / SB164P1) TaxID=1167006 RepID=M1P670_DESSD|nr:glycosyltransferase family 2 protein [Desulfocapsa sulfexigens]AGF78948.1 glycosyl transferase [Desulfocapsa sulfexigens DSM 10523]